MSNGDGNSVVWVQCTGEAHGNPYIDHCMVCLPYWEIYPTCPYCNNKVFSTKRAGYVFYCKRCKAYLLDENNGKIKSTSELKPVISKGDYNHEQHELICVLAGYIEEFRKVNMYDHGKLAFLQAVTESLMADVALYHSDYPGWLRKHKGFEA